MKTIGDVKITCSQGIITIVGKVVEREFNPNIEQKTVLYITGENRRWYRHIQISQEATFLKAYGSGIGILHDDLAAIANAIEPKTSYPPVIKSINPTTFTAEIISELDVTFQWESTESLNPDKLKWEPVESQTTDALDKTKVLAGRFVRLSATNQSGTTYSNPIQVK